MIKKIVKNIHSKYLNFFKFFFFLKYILSIFFISILLFFFTPKIFDYSKRTETIKTYLFNNYDLQIKNFSTIKYHVFPLPNLSIYDADLKIKDKAINVKTRKIKIFLNFKNIYNYDSFKAQKIVFNETETDLDIDLSKEFFIYFTKLKSRLGFETFNINFKKRDRTLFKLKKINFYNYGFKKNKINGEIFGKRFKVNLSNNNKNLSFKILNTGIIADFKFDDESSLDKLFGYSKISFLNNFLKFNFYIDKNKIQINKSSFKNKELSISFNSLIDINPFFEISSNIKINQISSKFINNISLAKILKNKEIIKKLNSKDSISYNSKKIFNTFVKSFHSKSSFSYGRLAYSNNIVIQGGNINCEGDSLLTEEYPRLNFICSINLEDQKKIFKRFSISKKINSKGFGLEVKGSLNLLNKKINFKKITTSNNYIANETDIKYFKKSFENILFDEDFFKIFNIEKIDKFLQEVI